MKLAIFGATGGTGRVLVRQALERGHGVRAFTRSPDKLADEAKWHENLELVEGDVRDADAVRTAIDGVDAVLSVLGPTANEPDYQVSAGTKNIVAAMRDLGVDRLLVTAGAGVGFAQDQPGPVNRLVKGLLLLLARHVYEDMKRTVEVVRDTELKWTIVRLPRLTDARLQRP